jgi:hypothetical protein
MKLINELPTWPIGGKQPKEPKEFAAFLKTLVEIANKNAELNDGTTGPIKRIVADNDVVFAIWQDHSAPYGVNMLPIKGTQRLLEGTRYQIAITPRTSAIPVDNIEMAIAARDVLGDGGGEGVALQ